MAQKIIFLRGLPGSGKSTWAKEFIAANPDWVRTNMDEIREIYFPNTPFSRAREHQVIEIETEEITKALNAGKNILNDNTNFNPTHRERILNLAKTLGIEVEWEIKDFNTPLSECIKRNKKRANPVPVTAILRMWNKYLKPSPPEFIPGAPSAIIVDVDGTLADKGDRSPYERDFSIDGLIEPVVNLVRTQKAFYGDWLKVIIVSGRHSYDRKVTEDWLFGAGIYFDALYMRNGDDDRPDYVVKREIYDNNIKGKYNILYCIDDRKQIKYNWIELGLFVFDVNQTDDDY